MKRIDDLKYKDYIAWAERNYCNQVYPLSIAEGIQPGDIFVDDEKDTKSVLFWHYSGFAYISGTVSEKDMEEILTDICHRDKRRLVLITDDNAAVSFLEHRGYDVSKRIEYEYAGYHNDYSFDNDFEIRKIDESNINLISGGVIPGFYWGNELFLQKGFGYAAFNGDEYCGNAFSSSISSKEVDIGIEVAPGHRGRGIAAALACMMCEEIILKGKKPVWAHAESNMGSMKTALKCGFVQKKTNSFCCIKQAEDGKL